MNTRPALPLCLLLLLAACAVTSGPGARGDPTASATALVSARLGESVDVGPVRITPLSVEEDSRCPADATCVHGGTLRVQTLIRAHVVETVRVLRIDEPASLGGRWIELVAGCPYPLASQPTPPAQRRYVFTVGSEPRQRPEAPPDFCA